MTNTETLASRIAARATDILADRLAGYEGDERYDFVEYETAVAFRRWLESITFSASPDGREVHAVGSANFGWTFTPVEIGDNACSPFWAELDEAGFSPEWFEPAPAQHVLRLF